MIKFEQFSPPPVAARDQLISPPILPWTHAYIMNRRKVVMTKMTMKIMMKSDCQPLCQLLIPDGQAVQLKCDLRVQEPRFSAPAHALSCPTVFFASLCS